MMRFAVLAFAIVFALTVLLPLLGLVLADWKQPAPAFVAFEISSTLHSPRRRIARSTEFSLT